jgi:hypothetical protein
MTFILPSFGASAISAVPASGGGGGGGALTNTYSLDFDGSDDYVDTGSTFQSTYRSNHTISFWFKFDTTAVNQTMFGVWDSNNLNAVYFTSSSGVISHRYQSGGSKATTVITAPTDANWHHYAVTLTQNGSNLDVKTYLDGVYTSTNTPVTITMSSFTQSLNSYIGKRNRPSDTLGPFDGKMDEVAIFGSALSDGGVSTGQTAGGDISTLYNSGVPGDLDTFNPIGWWRMGDTGSDYGTATITNAATGSNSGGSSINGTIVNGSSGNTSPTFSTDAP